MNGESASMLRRVTTVAIGSVLAVTAQLGLPTAIVVADVLDPPITKLLLADPDVYYEQSASNEFPPMLQAATQDFRANSNVQPRYFGPNVGAAYTHWHQTSCYFNKIVYMYAHWRRQDWIARTMPRRILAPMPYCNRLTHVFCVDTDGKVTGLCDMENYQAHWVLIQVNAAHPDVPPRLQHMVTHEMGHAFGLSHRHPWWPWWGDSCGPSSVMWGPWCWSWRRSDVPDFIGYKDVAIINALYAPPGP